MSRNFIAIDVETANPSRSSICQIGLVRVHEGNLQDPWSTLVNPECDFYDMCIATHGIHHADVEHSPTMPDVWDEIRAQTRDSVLVSHSKFDPSAFNKVAEKYSLPKLNVKWADSLQISKKVWPDLPSYSLDNLAKEFGIPLQHHNALEDAKACAKIVLQALSKSDTSIEKWATTFQHRDKKTTPDSRKIIYQLEQKASGISLEGENVLFTLKLRAQDGTRITKAKAHELVRMRGGNPLKNFNRDITMLVVGEKDKKATKGHDKSQKHRDTLDQIKKGAKINISSSQDFFEMLLKE